MYIQVDNVICKCSFSAKDVTLVPNIEKTLSSYFEVKYPDSRYIKSDKNYNGEVTKKFYKYSTLPTGLLPYLLTWAAKAGIEVTIEDQRTNSINFREDFRTTYGSKELAPHQIELVESCKKHLKNGLPYYRGIWDSATNSGKTLTSMALVDNLEGAKALFLVDRETIMIGAHKEFSPFMDIGLIKSGFCKIGKDITIAMVKTLKSLITKKRVDTEFLEQFNVLIVDECHKAGGKEYRELIAAIPAYVRVFISGTPLEVDDLKKMYIIANSGPVLKKITNKNMIDAGFSTRPVVYIHAVRYTAKEQMEMYGSYEQVRQKYLYESERRMEIIAKLCEERTDKQIFISFREKSHGYFILEFLKKSLPTSTSIDIVHGTSSNRQGKIDKFISHETNILISSVILQEGANIPNIDVMINGIAGKSPIALKQFLGRELRTHKGKEVVEFHDFYDDVEYLDGHSRARIKKLIAEEIEVIFTYDHHATNFRPKTDFKK